MLWTEIGIATLREPQHPLLVRAAYMRGREYLPLGLRALARIEKVLGEHDERGRALELCGVGSLRVGCEFVVRSESGAEVLVEGNGYASLSANAVSAAQAPRVRDPEGDLEPEEFYTPGVKSIAQIAEFTGLPATSQIKSLVLIDHGQPLLVLLRGDHQFNFAKLPGTRPAEPEEIRRYFGADPGSLGPVDVAGVRIVADEALRGRRNMIAGANRNDHHLRNVTPGEDFAAEFADLRQVAPGDLSITDGQVLQFSKVTLLDTAESVLHAAVAQNQDADGIVLPAAIAPFTLIVTPVHPERLEAAREIYRKLAADAVDVLLDDRDARPGGKFKDDDLIGIPYRINVGKKLTEGLVEMVERRSRRSSDVAVNEISIPR
jgi:prolyl-tRNA synthetase